MNLEEYKNLPITTSKDELESFFCELLKQFTRGEPNGSFM